MALKLQSLFRSVCIRNYIPSRNKCFKSDISLDKIYPNSTEIKPFTPPEQKDNEFSGYIPIKELEITYCKSSAPGGQNVNKLATKVDMRFHVQSANWLSEEMKKKIMEKYKTKINKEGYFVVRSEKTKDVLINRLDAMTKLREYIYNAEEPPPPQMSEETAEKKRKLKEKAIRERLIEKRARSLERRMKLGDL